MRLMRIGSFDTADRVLVVAEIGNNHEGNADLAAQLVREAAASGARAVKFQVVRARHLVSARDEARFARLSSFELPYETFAALAELARSLGLLFIATPLDLASARFLADRVDAFKIASGDNDFYPLLECVAASGRPLIVSSRLSDLEQITRSTRAVEATWDRVGVPKAARQLAVLHCVSSYPAPPEDVHLSALAILERELHCTIGYSDHTLGTEACIAAVAAGAQIVEKHFTIDKQYSAFRDHQLSADPEELRELVAAIARVTTLLGRPHKAIQPSEAAQVQAIRRSIVAAADLPAGHQLVFDDLTWIRPATGLRPGDEPRLIGRTLRRAVAFGEPILLADVT
jgi:N,N'-diacetyllegionaminate synthase